jgi:hypothetical protein
MGVRHAELENAATPLEPSLHRSFFAAADEHGIDVPEEMSARRDAGARALECDEQIRRSRAIDARTIVFVRECLAGDRHHRSIDERITAGLLGLDNDRRGR